MLASTLKLRPRYFLIVLALAGDSTITRLVLPLATGPPLSPFLLRVEADEDERLTLFALVLAFVVLFRVAPVEPVVFLVVAIFLLLCPIAQTTSLYTQSLLRRERPCGHGLILLT
jgi:hypothetical protein